jgi:two-component system NtrC family sensor kinase
MSRSPDVNYIAPVSQSEAATLQAIVELVRRIMHADASSILSYSLDDERVTWKAASGFLLANIDYEKPVFRPLAAAIGRQALADNKIVIFEGLGLRPDLPAESFPVHVADGIHDLAVAPLRIHGNQSGAVTAGFRSRHLFTEDEKRVLQNLAEMASVALNNAQLLETVSAAETMWKQAFDRIDEGVLVYDEHRRISRCNARAADMIEMHPDKVMGMLFDDAFARLVGDGPAAYYLSQERGERSAFEAQTEAGRRYLISISSEHSSGQMINVTCWRDVTRLSEMQDQLARTRRLGSVGQLAAGVAHEINNPLAAIATCAEAITRDLRRDESLQAAANEHQWPYYLEEIVRQSLRCKEITRGLLDLTQQRHARLALCDLHLIVRQCTKSTLQQPDAKTVEFEMELDEKVREVATDEAMLRQVLDNLLTNAVEALGEKGGRVTVSTAREGDRVVIQVADDAAGISPELLARVFDPFVSTKTTGKNYGLGLAISAALAEAMGGALNVESKEGEGSRFRLWIPLRAPQK